MIPDPRPGESGHSRVQYGLRAAWVDSAAEQAHRGRPGAVGAGARAGGCDRRSRCPGRWRLGCPSARGWISLSPVIPPAPWFPRLCWENRLALSKWGNAMPDDNAQAADDARKLRARFPRWGILFDPWKAYGSRSAARERSSRPAALRS